MWLILIFLDTPCSVLSFHQGRQILRSFDPPTTHRSAQQLRSHEIIPSVYRFWNCQRPIFSRFSLDFFGVEWYQLDIRNALWTRPIDPSLWGLISPRDRHVLELQESFNSCQWAWQFVIYHVYHMGLYTQQQSVCTCLTSILTWVACYCLISSTVPGEATPQQYFTWLVLVCDITIQS